MGRDNDPLVLRGERRDSQVLEGFQLFHRKQNEILLTENPSKPSII